MDFATHGILAAQYPFGSWRTERVKNMTLRRVAMLSVHTSPLASLGGKETGGMNVYIREACRALAKRGWQIDIFTRAQDDGPQVIVDQPAPGCRTIHIGAGPRSPMDRREVFSCLPEFAAGMRAFRRQDGAESV